MKIETLFNNSDSVLRFLPSRRDFLKNMSLSVALLWGFGLGGIESWFEKIANRPTRRPVNPDSTDSMTTVEIYEEAINLMKALPSSDGRSWDNQAGIHGTILGGFNRCNHQNSFFLPWHRAYLYYFEKICQKLTGESSFGLPYWNWTRPFVFRPGVNSSSSIPSPFWDTSSALYYSDRDATSSDVPPFDVVSQSRMETILDETNFLLFGSDDSGGAGPLEAGPHNTIHNFVGGTMGTGGAALDPIFWTHHCMIDYCWDNWNINRGHDNPNDETWLDQEWTDFVDEDGNSVKMSVRTTLLMPLLAYQYESSQIGAPAALFPLRSEAAFRRLRQRLERGAQVRLAIKKRIPFSRGMDLSTSKIASRELPVKARELKRLFETEHPDRALINIGFASMPKATNFFVRVFVNKQDTTMETKTEDIHYAGSFAFFGSSQAEIHQHKSASFLVDITNTLKNLRQKGMLKDDDTISLSFVAVPVTPSRVVKEEILQLEKLDLLLSPISVSERQ